MRTWHKKKVNRLIKEIEETKKIYDILNCVKYIELCLIGGRIKDAQYTMRNEWDKICGDDVWREVFYKCHANCSAKAYFKYKRRIGFKKERN